jgi:hypothetical protein
LPTFAIAFAEASCLPSRSPQPPVAGSTDQAFSQGKFRPADDAADSFGTARSRQRTIYSREVNSQKKYSPSCG